jgi:hypothetical protein
MFSLKNLSENSPESFLIRELIFLITGAKSKE